MHRQNGAGAPSFALQVDWEIKRSCNSKKMQWNYSNAAINTTICKAPITIRFFSRILITDYKVSSVVTPCIKRR